MLLRFLGIEKDATKMRDQERCPRTGGAHRLNSNHCGIGILHRLKRQSNADNDPGKFGRKSGNRTQITILANALLNVPPQ